MAYKNSMYFKYISDEEARKQGEYEQKKAEERLRKLWKD